MSAKSRALGMLAVSCLMPACSSAEHFVDIGLPRSGGIVGSGGAVGGGGAPSEASGGTASFPSVPVSTTERSWASPPKPGETLPGLCDPKAGEDAQTPLGISSAELATRLSKLFWNIAPPDYLLPDAEKRNLRTLGDAACFAQGMLNDPRSAAGVSHFFLDWLDHGALPNLAKDASLYPNFTAETAVAARAAAQAFIGHVFFPDPSMAPQPAPLMALLTAKFGYVNQALSQTLGVPSSSASLEFVEVLPQDRLGLLGQPYFAMVESSATSSSPTRRGNRIGQSFLCTNLPPPPMGVITTAPAPDPSLTTRQAFESNHTSNPACMACHQLMDEPGFAFEHFDAVGTYRTVEANKPVDTAVSLPSYRFLQWSFGPDKAADHAGFAQLLAKSEQVRACLSARWIAHSEAVIWDKATPKLPSEVDPQSIAYVLRRGRYSADTTGPVDLNYFDLKQMMLAVVELPTTYAAAASLR